MCRSGAAFNINGLLDVTEAVPFRLTPNLQQFMTAVGLEGVFSSALMAIARSLVEPEVHASTASGVDARSAPVAHGGECRGMVGVVALQLQLSEVLNIFIRDELLAWLASMPQRPQSQPEPPLRDRVAQNVENIMTRMRNLACLPPAERVCPLCRNT